MFCYVSYYTESLGFVLEEFTKLDQSLPLVLRLKIALSILHFFHLPASFLCLVEACDV
jgi:hypothetical protein